MTKQALDQVVQKYTSDAAFREAVQANAKQALKGYDLSEQEIAALMSGDSAKMAELGLTYEHIPMTALHVKDDHVVGFLRIAGAPDRAPIFVHCQRGADRTGLMCAVYRIAFQGWTKDQAIAEMTQGGFRFNHGYQNVVNYIRDVDIDQMKQRAGLTPQLVGAR